MRPSSPLLLVVSVELSEAQLAVLVPSLELEETGHQLLGSQPWVA